MKFYLETYGCTANKADESLIKGTIKSKNHEIVKDIDKADILVILTCTVIDTTEQRMLSRLKKLKKTGKKIVVAGCMASIQKDIVKKILPKAVFLPPQYPHHIIDVIEKKDFSFKHKNKTDIPKVFENKTAPISISEGCMFRCSYCITCFARGKLKSFPIKEIGKNIKSAVKKGCIEIQLTSQDTSSYGLDKNKNLGELLKNIKTIKGKYKIRVGMMNPYTCLLNLDSIIKGYNNTHIYKFLHLPVQSGDNKILEKMNRKYTVEEFLEIIKTFRKKYPEITISTDLIVAFPSETDKQFNKTVELIKKVKPDITNITRYSARPNTKAKKMKKRIKTEVAKERSKALTKICKKISTEKNKECIGKKFDVLIIEKRENNIYFGRTNNYKPVLIKKEVEIGSTQKVEINDADYTHLVGSII